ncbi:hypothetical protein ACM55F_07685 [Flavobacterium sp. XS2P12]|uniref:hypothetical protein n=1 Tax=Flavobacterium melibiosi TaxID=3398734 RepID=UPI003A8B014E
MRKIFLPFFLIAFATCFGQRVVSVFEVEGGFLSGGLSGQDGYDSSLDFNGSLCFDLIRKNKKDKPTVGIKLKLNYNSYNMEYVKSFVNPPPNIIIKETSIPVLLKFCLKSSKYYFTKEVEGERRTFVNSRGLFLFAGPQIGFVSITGGAEDYSKKNYSIVVGGEFYINRFYIFLYQQNGLTEIFPSQSSVRLNGVNGGFGIVLF